MIWTTIFALVVSVVLTSCAQQQDRQTVSSKLWNVNERADFGPAGEYMEKFIRVAVNPGNLSDGYFDLYYFVHKPGGAALEIKTVLFCAGGPGEVVEPGDASLVTFLRKYNATNYNIVYFHLRGAGLSQLPPSNDYDRFLRTKFATDDIEQIRKEVLGDQPWDGVVGYSYGTVLAQQYAAKYNDKVRKLVLVGPLSTHKFNGPSSTTAYDDYAAAVRQIRQEIVTHIFADNLEFKNQLTDAEKEGVKRRLTQVFDTIETNFGNEQFVIERYCQLKNRGLLSQYGLQGYSRRFFQQLRELRNIGWKPYTVPGPNLREVQLEAVQVISVGLTPELKAKLGVPRPDDECAVDSNIDPRMDTDHSYRTLYGMRTYDGAYQSFLKEWIKENRNHVYTALRKSAGLAHIQNGVNESIEKVGIAENEPIKAWDPANHQHNVPTLILAGGADPVTADGQAKHYFERALIGQRTLIDFPGVGHDFNLPVVKIDQPFIIGSLRLDPGRIAAGGAVTVKNRVTTAVPPALGKLVGGAPTTVKFLEAIFAPHSNLVFVLAQNTMASDQNVNGQQINYEHRLFTVTVAVDPSPVPFGKSWVSGSVIKITAKFTVETPGNLEPGLDVESSHMDHWDELTVKIKNTTAQPVEAKPKNWILFTREENIGQIDSPCQGVRLQFDQPARSCLIYSFLEMEYEDFKSSKNEILKQLEIQHLALPAEHCAGNNC